MRITILYSIFLIFVLSCGNTPEQESPLIAKVGKSLLTKAEIEKLKLSIPNKTYSETDIIGNWVDRELLFMAAQEAGIENDETLKSQIDIYRKDLFGRTFLDNHIASLISVENSEIRDYYDKNRSMFRHKNNGAKIMQFFTTVDTTANFIATTLKNTNSTVDRKDLLLEYQVSVSSVEQGSLVDELDNPIFSTNRSNIVIGPIQSEYGYHVIEVIDRYAKDSSIDLDEAYDEIYQIIYNQKKQMYSVAFFDSLRNHYNVKIYLENY